MASGSDSWSELLRSIQALDSDLRSELQSIEELMRESSHLFPYVVGVARVRQRLGETEEEDEGVVVVVNPVTQRAIFLGFGGLDSEAKSGPAPASKPAIESLPVSAMGEDDQGLECTICLEEMAVGEDAKWMPCRHRFHPGCIDKWLARQGTCPVCRFVMPVDEAEGKKDGDRD